MNCEELELYLNNLLKADQFRDYCPNGLQVQGRQKIKKIATGVTASLAFLEAAVQWGADAVLVHHGYFWKQEAPVIKGLKQRRLRTLLLNDINLFAYHLPLDAHAELGNNACLGERLGWRAEGRFGTDQLGWIGSLSEPMTLADLAMQVERTLHRKPLVLGESQAKLKKVRCIAWCTGAAQNFFSEAIAAGAEVYLSGEVSEPTMHLAHESGVAYIAAGHHATERYGVQALGAHLAETFGLTHKFIEIDNPV